MKEELDMMRVLISTINDKKEEIKNKSHVHSTMFFGLFIPEIKRYP
jgi:hypothetical protein